MPLAALPARNGAGASSNSSCTTTTTNGSGAALHSNGNGSHPNGISPATAAPEAGELLDYLSGGGPRASKKPPATKAPAVPTTPDGHQGGRATNDGTQQQQQQGAAAVYTSLPVFAPNEVFVCPEESSCYSQSIERLVFNRCVGEWRVFERGGPFNTPNTQLAPPPSPPP
jgi:hypothetical protein